MTTEISIPTINSSSIIDVYKDGVFNPKYAVLLETGVTRMENYLQAKGGFLVFDGASVSTGMKIMCECEQTIVGGQSNYNILSKFNGTTNDTSNCCYPNYGHGAIGCIVYLGIVHNGGNFGFFNGSGCTVKIKRIWLDSPRSQ